MTIEVTVAAIWMVSICLALLDQPLCLDGSRRRPALFSIPLQILATSLIGCCALMPGMLLGPWGLIAWVSWPLAAPYLFIGVFLTQYSEFLSVPVAVAMLAAALTAWRTAKSSTPYTAIAWPTLAIIAFFGVFAGAGEAAFRLRLAAAVNKLNPDCADAGSILRALSLSGTEHQPSLHATAKSGNAVYAWSFRQLDFYRIPEAAVSNVGSPRGPIGQFPSCYDVRPK